MKKSNLSGISCFIFQFRVTVVKLITRNSNLWSEVYYAWCMRRRPYIDSEFWLHWHSRKVSQALRHRFCGHICFVSGDTQARQTKMPNKHWRQALRVCVSLRRNTVSSFLFVCLREVTGKSVERDAHWAAIGGRLWKWPRRGTGRHGLCKVVAVGWKRKSCIKELIRILGLIGCRE